MYAAPRDESGRGGQKKERRKEKKERDERCGESLTGNFPVKRIQLTTYVCTLGPGRNTGCNSVLADGSRSRHGSPRYLPWNFRRKKSFHHQQRTEGGGGIGTYNEEGLACFPSLLDSIVSPTGRKATELRERVKEKERACVCWVDIEKGGTVRRPGNSARPTESPAPPPFHR